MDWERVGELRFEVSSVRRGETGRDVLCCAVLCGNGPPEADFGVVSGRIVLGSFTVRNGEYKLQDFQKKKGHSSRSRIHHRRERKVYVCTEDLGCLSSFVRNCGKWDEAGLT